MSGGVDPDELQTAAFFYDQKLQQNENSTYHHSLGALQLYKRNFDQAGNEFKKAVEVNPGNIGARNDLAVHYLKFGKYYDAEKQLSAAISYGTNQPILHRNLSATLARTGRYEEAYIHSRKAIQLNPYDASSHRNLAKLYDQTGDSRSSLEHNLHAVKLSSLHNNENMQLRTTLNESKAYRSAAGDITQALELVSAARHKEGREYVLPSSELTYEIINKIKQRQIKAGKISNSDQKLKDDAEALRKTKENIAKVKMGDFS